MCDSRLNSHLKSVNHKTANQFLLWKNCLKYETQYVASLSFKYFCWGNYLLATRYGVKTLVLRVLNYDGIKEMYMKFYYTPHNEVWGEVFWFQSVV
jgi:hypothetical protein